MKKSSCYLLIISSILLTGCTAQKISTPENQTLSIIRKVNDYWQNNHPAQKKAFWDNAAYHTGNMEVYFLTKEKKYLQYSTDWAEYNEWKGAKSDDKTRWKYTYGESDDYVLFGDQQICFQVYADLYRVAPDPQKNCTGT